MTFSIASTVLRTNSHHTSSLVEYSQGLNNTTAWSSLLAIDSTNRRMEDFPEPHSPYTPIRIDQFFGLVVAILKISRARVQRPKKSSSRLEAGVSCPE